MRPRPLGAAAAAPPPVLRALPAAAADLPGLGGGAPVARSMAAAEPMTSSGSSDAMKR
jgi:hypothetical protein